MRRAADEVQFGLSPGRGIVLGGLREAEAGWLLSLDAEQGTRSRARGLGAGAVLGSAPRWGLSSSRAQELLAVLGAHGLLARDADPVERRGGGDGQGVPRTCVLGRGPVPEAIRAQLGAAGISAVDVVEPADQPTPDLTVLVAQDAIALRDGSAWARSRRAHLPVVVQAHRVVLGPTVTTDGLGPCLVCLDLTRRDRDAAWPRIATAMTGATLEWDVDVTTDAALCGAAAGLCAMVAGAFLRGADAPDGVAWEVALPWPRVTARRWTRHPRCAEHAGDTAAAG